MNALIVPESIVASNHQLETDQATSKRLGKQKQKNTKPEIWVRAMLTELGHRYRLQNRDLPGSPDVANRSKRWAVFVHGCYWHHHEGCSRATIPKRNREFWVEKFMANRARDERVVEELEADGFTVVTVWECELKHDPVAISDRLRERLP